MENYEWVLQFDGGCSKRAGTGGYVLWSKNGSLAGGEYKYYGTTRSTNNEAEAQALVDALRFASIATKGTPEPSVLV